MKNNSYMKAANTLHCLHKRTRNVNKVTEHSQEDTSKALLFVSTCVEISRLSVMTVLAKHLRKGNEYIVKILISPRWYQLSLDSDTFSSKLKQASLLYAAGFNSVSMDILLDLEYKLRNQISVCSCSQFSMTAVS